MVDDQLLKDYVGVQSALCNCCRRSATWWLAKMLAKQVQTELAQANAVADEVLATMTTVRAHAADDSAKAAYAVKLAKFYVLQVYLKYSANLA